MQRHGSSPVRGSGAKIAKVFAARKMREKLIALGIEAVGSAPEQFTEHLKNEIARWTPVIHKARLKGD